MKRNVATGWGQNNPHIVLKSSLMSLACIGRAHGGSSLTLDIMF